MLNKIVALICLFGFGFYWFFTEDIRELIFWGFMLMYFLILDRNE